MIKRYIVIFVLFISMTTVAQRYTSATLFQKDGTTVTNRVFVNYDKEIFEFKKGSLRFDQVEKFQIKDRVYERMSLNQQGFFAHELQSGNASLFDLSGNRYLVRSKRGVLKIIELEKDHSKNIGVLSLLLSNCNELRDYLWQLEEIKEENLIAAVEQYNSCNYENFIATPGEIKRIKANKSEDLSVYLGLGYGFNAIRFDDDDESENMPSVQFQAGILGFPNTSIDGNNKLAISLELVASFGSKTDFQNTFLKRDIKINSFRILAGTDYYILRNKKVNPFIGINGGLAIDTYKGIITRAILDEPVAPLEDLKETRVNAIYGFKVGTTFALPSENELSFSINYFPEREKVVQEGLNRDLSVFNSFITLNVNYFF
ncbi:MAG: hypothetical protein CL867_02390 [Cytophagaceae bacterium]|nr:hypothetical protein [Cytophagaceae bacterium]